ncbi:hypothetical protein ACWD6R_31575 [Streptomyces sp. NPDC005151]
MTNGPVQQIANLFGVPRSTVYGHLDKRKVRLLKNIAGVAIAPAPRRPTVREVRPWLGR